MTGQGLRHTAVRADDGEVRHWLVLLHGIYGSGRNWGTIARRLVEERPEWGVVLPDLRLHGASTGEFPLPHSVENVAADVQMLVEELGITAEAVVGHSYGGKVALAGSRAHGEGLEQVWVIDSTLEVREPSGEAWDVLQAVRSLPERFASREAFAEGMAGHGWGTTLSSWLGMNLERAGDGLQWKLDWGGVEEMLRSYFDTDVWEVVEHPPAGVEVHVVRATRSDSLSDGDADRIRAASAAGAATLLHEVDSGHWINADNPEAILRLLAQHLPG